MSLGTSCCLNSKRKRDVGGLGFYLRLAHFLALWSWASHLTMTSTCLCIKWEDQDTWSLWFPFNSLVLSSFDGEGPTAKCLIKGRWLTFWSETNGLCSLLCHLAIPWQNPYLFGFFPCCSGTFCTHCIAFARPVSSSVFPQSLKTGHCWQRFLEYLVPQPISPNKTHGGLH